MGNGGQRPVDGVRKHGQRLRDRRCVHAEPVDRREEVLRRVPPERAGRGRRGRHPHAAADLESAGRWKTKNRSKRRCPTSTRSWSTFTRSSSRTTATCRTSSSRSSRGKLYLLQTRTGKRTGFAAVKIACDMVDEELISQTEAVERVEAGQITQLLAPVFDARRKSGRRCREDASSAAGFPPVPGPPPDASRSTPSAPSPWPRTGR